MRIISFTPSAYNDFVEWMSIDKKIFAEISTLIIETSKEPFKGNGKPEPLKNNLSGYWSGRINKEHRLVYKVTDISIEIISCKYHY